MKWGHFSSENTFNNWLKGKGGPLLLHELKSFFSTDFRRVSPETAPFGNPDHLFYSDSKKSLLLVECADKLIKKHFSKDLLYLFASSFTFEIRSKSLFWITLLPTSTKLIEIIDQIYSQFMILDCRVHFHLASIMKLSTSMLRLNLDYSFGERAFQINHQKTLADFHGKSSWISIKEAARILGTAYTTMFNIINKMHLDVSHNRISTHSLTQLINSFENTASTEQGFDFSGRFVYSYEKEDHMLFPAEVNKMLGFKGGSVRVDIKPRWITIKGSSNKGFRYLFDRKDVLDIKSTL
jgi:hypothetical protein